MERVPKILVGAVLALALAFLALTYGLYFLGARDIPDDWRPTSTVYPEHVRRAWWRIETGSEPVAIEAVSPPGMVWRWLGLAYGIQEGPPRNDPALQALGQAARLGQWRARTRRHHHLTQMAMMIRASRWPDDRIVDTILDQSYFGGDAYGLQAGARRVFARPLASLDAGETALLLNLMRGPGHFDPWCHGDRLRERLARSSGLDAARIDAAFARLAPPPLDSACR